MTQDIVYAIAVLPEFAERGICFAAGNFGLLRSDDGGESWKSALDSVDLDQPLPTTAIAVSPEFEFDQSLVVGAPGGVLRSVDGGRTFSPVAFRSPPPFVTTLAMSPNFARDGVLFAGTIEDGVFRSGDRGRHWTAWNFGLLDLGVLCMAISDQFSEDETLFIGTESGIFCSRNGGRAWRETAFAAELAPVLSLSLLHPSAQESLLLAGTESHGLLCSDDEGETWHRLGEESIPNAVNAIEFSLKHRPAVHILAALSTSLVVSRDSGRSWTEWKCDQDLSSGISCIAAPEGIEPDAPLLIGLVSGAVLRL